MLLKLVRILQQTTYLLYFCNQLNLNYYDIVSRQWVNKNRMENHQG